MRLSDNEVMLILLIAVVFAALCAGAAFAIVSALWQMWKYLRGRRK